MKKNLIIFLVLFLSYYKAQVLFKLQGDSLKSFVYAGGDEFSDDKVNFDYWKGPWTRINMAQNFRYNDSNIILRNGIAEFYMLKQDSVYPILGQAVDSAFLKESKISIANDSFAVQYSAGMLITRQKYHYGLYELKFKVEEGKGVWPAFWFYGGKENEEIDVFELKGEKNNVVHVDTHCPSGCDHGYKNKLGLGASFGGWMSLDSYLHEGFNTITLDWRPNELVWMLNGYPLSYFRGDFSNPMNVFINTQIAANGRAFSPGPDSTTKFPNVFFVDYLRIWQANKSETTIFLRKTKSISAIDTVHANYLAKPRVKRGLMYSKKKFNAEQGSVALFVLSDGSLSAQLLGNIKESAEIYLQGMKKKYVFDTGKVENNFILDMGEKKFELVIKFKNKEYRRKIEIVD